MASTKSGSFCGGKIYPGCLKMGFGGGYCLQESCNWWENVVEDRLNRQAGGKKGENQITGYPWPGTRASRFWILRKAAAWLPKEATIRHYALQHDLVEVSLCN
ncbi:hypothetical protein [Niastella populi]|nr:hypothetical protein [Niastella populi]